jgi:hypothetical protein
MGEVPKHSITGHFKMNTIVGYTLMALLLTCERKGPISEGASYDKTLLYHLW